MAEMWELCRASITGSGGLIFYSWKGEKYHGNNRGFMEKFYPDWLQKHPKKWSNDDLFLLLLSEGGEPYEATEWDDHWFRRKINN